MPRRNRRKKAKSGWGHVLNKLRELHRQDWEIREHNRFVQAVFRADRSLRLKAPTPWILRDKLSAYDKGETDVS